MTIVSQSLDHIDLQILDIVQPDASRSLAQIGQRVKRSRVACFRRLLRLKETGVIRRTVTLLDPASINLSTTAMVTIRPNRHDAPPLQQVARRVAEVAEVMDVFLVPERREMLLRVVMPRAAIWPVLKDKLQAYLPPSEITISIVECVSAKTALPLSFALARSWDNP
jgi:Lrp/AsnC family transcriptional regulator